MRAPSIDPPIVAVKRSHYDVVGAAPTATTDQLRRAYLRRARQLHPDQFVGRPAAERAKAERRMQDLNAAWTVLSDPSKRRAYDATLSPARVAGTGPIESGRDGAWRPYDEARRTQPSPKPKPKVADERDMEIRGPAKLLRPVPLLVLFFSMAALIMLAAVVTDGGDEVDAERRAPVVLPTGTPIGCIDLLPLAEEVPCGTHDAVVWGVVDAGESCPDELEAIYRQGLGGLYCVTRVG